MKKTLILYSLCLLLAVIINPAQSCFGEEERSTLQKDIPSVTDQSTYKIGSGDVLEIFTWKEADFTREVLVRNDGKFTFPLLGDIKAVGLTPMQLKDIIEKGIKGFIENPFVTVIVKDPASQKYYILGEVANTGEYPLTKDLTVLQAFTLAGGFTEWASKSDIILVRREDGKQKIIKINYKKIIKGEDMDNNVLLKANDTIIVR